jgi:hypothetical protein
VIRETDGTGHEEVLAGLGRAAWQEVAARSKHHGIAGLISRNLDWACERSGLGAPISDELRAARRQVLARNLARRAAARRVTESFEREGIPFLVLKGLALAEEIYGDLSLRAFNDLDVLVPREDVERAFQVASRLGYVPTSLQGIGEYVAHGAHAADMAHLDGTSLDLHWALAAEMPPLATELAWKSAVPAPAGSGLGGLRLSPEISVIHLAAHFHAHHYELLRPLVDFLHATRTPHSLDATVLWETARSLRLASLVEIAAVLGERSFGAGSFARILAGREIGSHATWASVVIPDALLLAATERPRIDHWLRYLLAAGGFGFAARAAATMLFPGKLAIARHFRSPFHARLYPRYYWRQILKALTLTNKA